MLQLLVFLENFGKLSVWVLTFEGGWHNGKSSGLEVSQVACLCIQHVPDLV